MMNMVFERKLAIPMEVKEMYPLNAKMAELVEARDIETKDILSGRSDKLMLIIGPVLSRTMRTVYSTIFPDL